MRDENCETKIDKIARPQSQTVQGSDFIIDGLQPIAIGQPRSQGFSLLNWVGGNPIQKGKALGTRLPIGLLNKGMATMLVEQTKEVVEKSFVYAHQHGGDDAGT